MLFHFNFLSFNASWANNCYYSKKRTKIMDKLHNF